MASTAAPTALDSWVRTQISALSKELAALSTEMRSMRLSLDAEIAGRTAAEDEFYRQYGTLKCFAERVNRDLEQCELGIDSRLQQLSLEMEAEKQQRCSQHDEMCMTYKKIHELISIGLEQSGVQRDANGTVARSLDETQTPPLSFDATGSKVAMVDEHLLEMPLSSASSGVDSEAAESVRRDLRFDQQPDVLQTESGAQEAIQKTKVELMSSVIQSRQQGLDRVSADRVDVVATEQQRNAQARAYLQAYGLMEASKKNEDQKPEASATLRLVSDGAADEEVYLNALPHLQPDARSSPAADQQAYFNALRFFKEPTPNARDRKSVV